MKLKIIYNNNNNNNNKIDQIIESFNTNFDCSIEKTDKSDVFKIYIDDKLAFNLEDVFDGIDLNYKYLCSKIDKFQKNRLLKSNNNKVGGLGDINFDEF